MLAEKKPIAKTILTLLNGLVYPLLPLHLISVTIAASARTTIKKKNKNKKKIKIKIKDRTSTAANDIECAKEYGFDESVFD